MGYKPSKNDRIIYELYPGYRIKSLDAKISSQGLNDRYFPISKPSDVYRIAVIGDSTSFGWQVGSKNSFPKILERILNEQKDKKFEVINFSVPGYNTSQEFEILKEKVVKFKPDMVILVYCGNDKHICNYIQSDAISLNYLYNKSYFFHFLLRCVDILMSHKSDYVLYKKWWIVFKKNVLGMYYYKQIICSYPGLEETIYVNGDPPRERNEVPMKYWYMLGYENYKIHLSKICDILKKNDIKFLSTGFFEPEAIKINKELDIKYIFNFYEVLKKENILYNDIQLPEYGHMNLRGHYLIAMHLLNYIKESKMI